ncbi:MAG: nitrilase [Desulfobacterales bacterium]|nr:nitrilase [Desulfobacterales bacterium]
MKDISVAAVVFNAKVGSIEENINKTAEWVKKAKINGAEIICFPEMNISGYFFKKKDSIYAKNLDVLKKIANLAEIENVIILAGIAERSDEGQIFASHFVIESSNKINFYRKIHIAPPEKELFSSSDDIPVFSNNKIKFGIQLCYDAHFPELSTKMALKGVDVIFFPHASPRKTPEEKFNSWMKHLRARAYDNSVFVVACNQVGNNENGLNFPGVGVIINPSGNIIEKYVGDKESMIISVLKEKDINHVRGHNMRYFLPNRRKLKYIY